MYILLVFLALGSVSTHDINVGSSTGGKKVFDEHFQASPAVWRQAQNVTINTTDDEVISRIVVTDLRQDKDGDAKIIEGGEGQKKVIIELKSPTVLRGFDFNVEVYATLNKEYQSQKNGPLHPSEFKSNAGSLNTPTPGSKITPLSSTDFTTKSPETPKTQSNPTNTEAKQNNARQTRDTDVKIPENNRPKVEPPSVFVQKTATTVKPGTITKDSNLPVNIGNRQFGEDTRDDEKTTEKPSLKTNNGEVRHVRDTHEDDAATKNSPKQGSFGSKTTTTADKTPSYNLNINNPVTSHPVFVANEGRDVRATQKDDGKNVSPTLIATQRNPIASSQSNPTVYTPNFERNLPSLINSKGTVKDTPLNDQKRSARSTQAESKEINTPKIDSLANPAIANKRADNITNDEERKTRNAQEGPRITPLNVDITEITTTASLILTKQDDETSDTNKQSSLKPPGILMKSQNYPIPYPYEATTKAGSTTKSPFKRDTESQEPQTDKNVKLNPKTFGTFETTNISSTTKAPFKRDTGSSEEHKDDDKNVKLNPKTFGTFETTNVSSTTKPPFKRDTGSLEPKDDDKNVKLNPKSIGDETSTKVSSTTKSPVKRDTESSEEVKDDDKNDKLNPKSFGTYQTSTKVSSTTKSPVKRDIESSEESYANDKNFKVIPKAISIHNATSHDHKVPVVSLQ